MANPVDYDTRDGCTRLRNQGAFLHPLFFNKRRIDLINQFLMDTPMPSRRWQTLSMIVSLPQPEGAEMTTKQFCIAIPPLLFA